MVKRGTTYVIYKKNKTNQKYRFYFAKTLYKSFTDAQEVEAVNWLRFPLYSIALLRDPHATVFTLQSGVQQAAHMGVTKMQVNMVP